MCINNENPSAKQEAANGRGDAGKMEGAKKDKAGKLSVERVYQKKTQLEHILLRPDTYIGSVEPLTQVSLFQADAVIHDPDLFYLLLREPPDISLNVTEVSLSFFALQRFPLRSGGFLLACHNKQTSILFRNFISSHRLNDRQEGVDIELKSCVFSPQIGLTHTH